MILSWTDKAWEDYLFWQAQDRKILKRINALIKDTQRNPFEGLGNPEPLKHQFSGFWSRRIDKEHRFVFRIKDNTLEIISCRTHYGK